MTNITQLTSSMDKQKIRKISYIVLFTLICAATIYFQLLQNTVNQLLNSGFSIDLIYLTLTVPFITLLVSITRTLIGMNISTIYIPVILILTALSIGLNPTLIFLILSLLLAMFIKLAITDFHFHFTSKISLILSLVAFGIILSLPLLNSIIPNGISNSNADIILFAILLISLINEKFFNFKFTKNNLGSDIKQLIKTIIFSVICFIILGGAIDIGPINFKWDWLQKIIISYPDIIFVSLILNILIGQYTGLRFDEIIRFRKLIFKSK